MKINLIKLRLWKRRCHIGLKHFYRSFIRMRKSSTGKQIDKCIWNLDIQPEHLHYKLNWSVPQDQGMHACQQYLETALRQTYDHPDITPSSIRGDKARKLLVCATRASIKFSWYDCYININGGSIGIKLPDVVHAELHPYSFNIDYIGVFEDHRVHIHWCMILDSHVEWSNNDTVQVLEPDNCMNNYWK